MAANQGGIYSVLDDERINARADFFNALGERVDGSWATTVGTIIPSDSEIENYNWLGTAPKMQEWRGPLLASELPNYSATLKNVEYASGLDIQKADVRRDKTGQIRRRVAGLGEATGAHWEELVDQLIIGSETASGTDLSGKPFDGQAFFDTDHSYTGSNYTTNQSNDLSSGVYDVATATAPTTEEAADILNDLVGSFYALKDDQGRGINGNVSSWLVMVGTVALWAPLNRAATADNLAGGETNPVRNFNINVVLNPALSAKTTKVYCFATGQPLGSFILQDEVAVDVMEEDPGKRSKVLEVTATATRSAGYGLWQKAMLATLS